MLEDILKDCISIIKAQGWKLPDNIKIKTAKNYYKDKPFSPSFVDRKKKTVYVMSSLEDEGIIKRLVLHELLHLTDMNDYGHEGEFKKKTDLLNKKYNLKLPHAAEDMLDGKEIFKKNPDLKRQIYKIVANNAHYPINKLTDKQAFKMAPNKIIKEDYFPY